MELGIILCQRKDFFDVIHRLLPSLEGEGAIARNRDLIVGIKTAHFDGIGYTAIDRAVAAGRQAGVPVMVDGHCVGAVGVSGVKSAEDAQVAKAGIAALG